MYQVFAWMIIPFLSCNWQDDRDRTSTVYSSYTSVVAMLAPNGFVRVAGGSVAYSHWLRDLPLKSDKTVYLYNGELKRDQSVQYAIINMPVGKRDLQQCAEAI